MVFGLGYPNNMEVITETKQVLFKRKPFALLEPPSNVPDDAQVYVMRGTGEVFVDYEKYLKRYDYLIQASGPHTPSSSLSLTLKQKKFVDAVNGKSGLTYFDALESESKSTIAIETVFPEVLREPILRRIQFSIISRIDDLVNAVYDEFKRDFFPGEEVLVQTTEGGESAPGVIREKAKFPLIKGIHGEIQRPAFSRYFVRLQDVSADEALLDDQHVRRDRKVFTKQNLRAFLKHSLQREAWIGAPWLVKEPLAIHYKLPMEIPAALLQDAKVLHKVKDAVHLHHNVQYCLAPQPFNDIHRIQNPADFSQQQQMPTIKPPRKRAKNFSTQDEMNRLRHEEMLRMQQMQQVSYTSSNPQQAAHVHKHPGAPPPQHPNGSIPTRSLPRPPPPPPPPKYPIEDLDLPPKRNGVVRPELEFFTEDMARYVKDGRKKKIEGLDMASMGMLLEVWNTLNVQCEVYFLDSFTFDDFVDAMQYRSLDIPCELLDEVHCAVLKLLVDDKGKVTLSKGALPDMIVEAEDESSESAQDDSELSTPLPDAPARSTRSRLSHVEPSKSPVGPAEKIHRATEMLADRTWVTRLAAREFEEGGWQVILVGLLHQLSQSKPFKTRCEDVLRWLAPMDQEPTKETAQSQYATMSVNLRISALQMMTILSIATPAIKNFLETCSEDMTDVRKKKIEAQRQKKETMIVLNKKDQERKIQLPDNMLPDSPEVSVEPVSVNGDADEDSPAHADSSDPDDAAPVNSRSLRRSSDRKRKRDADLARLAEEKKKKAEEAKQQPKQSKEFRKILADIVELKNKVLDLEERISECDGDLREANVQRTKVLGKDRFCNRYYWFERNGQPFGGLPSSSTSGYGYANGRIWVQGPDEMERDGFIDRTPEEQKAYERHFGVTVPERRRMEEGVTRLQSAEEWGYYDDPAVLDTLIGWLDERGEREKRLRRELLDWREMIVQYMEAHKNFKDQEAAKKVEADEEHEKRISTRHKAHEDQTASRERCLKWTNGSALAENGHLHSQPPRPKPKQKVQIRAPKGVAVPLNRHGRPVTRQG